MEAEKQIYERVLDRVSVSNSIEGEDPIYRLNASSIRRNHEQFVKKSQDEIDTLNAEKTQIMNEMSQ